MSSRQEFANNDIHKSTNLKFSLSTLSTVPFNFFAWKNYRLTQLSISFSIHAPLWSDFIMQTSNLRQLPQTCARLNVKRHSYLSSYVKSWRRMARSNSPTTANFLLCDCKSRCRKFRLWPTINWIILGCLSRGAGNLQNQLKASRAKLGSNPSQSHNQLWI